MAAGEFSGWREKLSTSLLAEQWPDELQSIVTKLANGTSLDRADGHVLFNSKDLDSIGSIANIIKQSRFGDRAFFNVNVHINQTNICTLACKFCAFRRGRRAPDAYQLDIDEYIEDLRQYADHVDEVHSVGGLHPEWDVEHYMKLFSTVKKEFPDIHIKSLTAVEIKHLSNLSNLSIKETLSSLHESGLDSLPGGGAEILDDDVRRIICNGKESSQEYLDIHATAHELGIPTNCTMLFGTVESIDQRLTHLIKLRDLQSQTGGFQCFVPYPYLPDDSRLPQAQLATGSEILRMIAISRIFLDNIPHIKAYRMNIGDEIAELALRFGADDIDGTVQKESIMHLAGSKAPLDHDKAQLARLVIDAGAKPIRRNTVYSSFEEYIIPKVTKTRKLRMAAGE
ncbi:MAG: CofH family radical SAM protein [Candidatus Poseidoniaceae archaeon]|nr:aminofutalosine synthase MqnE [Euryarchaeota archaeon]OUX48967.1 MAG: hypothetical protein CBE39_01420 [Euryarchaeota archaeon TMED279]|tara:strand:+ start:125 stop:1315 length:1191 start_codon:yes stop_codon:yes gene_type:complete